MGQERMIYMNLFQAANQYIQESDWKVIAVMKFCLLSLGMLIGMHLPTKCKKAATYGCGVLFLVTYLPLMAKLIRIFLRGKPTAPSA